MHLGRSRRHTRDSVTGHQPKMTEPTHNVAARRRHPKPVTPARRPPPTPAPLPPATAPVAVTYLLLRHRAHTVLAANGNGGDAWRLDRFERILDLVQAPLRRKDGNVPIVAGAAPAAHGERHREHQVPGAGKGKEAAAESSDPDQHRQGRRGCGRWGRTRSSGADTGIGSHNGEVAASNDPPMDPGGMCLAQARDSKPQ